MKHVWWFYSRFGFTLRTYIFVENYSITKIILSDRWCLGNTYYGNESSREKVIVNWNLVFETCSFISCELKSWRCFWTTLGNASSHLLGNKPDFIKICMLFCLVLCTVNIPTSWSYAESFIFYIFNIFVGFKINRAHTLYRKIGVRNWRSSWLENRRQFQRR